jgi:FAD/FMN-containing dehydrogenase
VPAPDPDGLYRPSSEQDVADLVRWAGLRGVPVRVHGSEHSVDDAIGTRGLGLDLSLNRLDAISFDDARRQVTVGAGRRLGANPRDRSGASTLRAGLCWQLEQRGWALPVTAGVTHQTVAGFLMTGSAGGSREHALTEQVVALRIIDGRGQLHSITRDDERFDGVVVSMGLLGIVTSVTLQCVERFDVEGYEQVQSAARFDLAHELDELLEANEYARVFWWPQPGVDKLIVWAANRAQRPGPTVPYEILPRVAGSALPAQAVAGTIIGRVCRRGTWNRGLATIYNAFLPAAEAKSFRDAWWRLIPMDDELDERFFPSTYTELWFPKESGVELVSRLRAHFGEAGFAATGAYTFELYGAKASPFWMSPGYGRDSVRLNICWMQGTPGDPRTGFFPQFWALLSDLGFRLHWGKYLFADPGQTRAYLRDAYPRFEEFLELRSRMDPDGSFLSPYWREHLGVGGPVSAVKNGSGEVAIPQAPRGRWRWPLLFKLRHSDASFAERAPFVIDEHAVIGADAGDIYDAIVDLVGARDWLADFVRAEWLSGPDADGNQVVDEIFTFMTERVRTFHAERGVRWMASLDACTLPLARELMQDLELAPLPDGRTQLRWRFYYEPYAVMRPLRPILHGFFAKMVREDIARLDKHLVERRTQAGAGTASAASA